MRAARALASKILPALLLALCCAAPAWAGSETSEVVFRRAMCALELQGEGKDLSPALAEVFAAFMAPKSGGERHLARLWNGRSMMNEPAAMRDGLPKLKKAYERFFHSRYDMRRHNLGLIDSALAARAGHSEIPLAQEQDEIAIVVHQAEQLQAETAMRLDRIPGLRTGARVLLVSARFAAMNSSLLGASSQIVYSRGGELGLEGIRAERVHMFGGYSQMCFSVAMEELVRGFLWDTDREHLEIVLHSSLIYVSPDGRTLRARMETAEFHGIEAYLWPDTLSQARWELQSQKPRADGRRQYVYRAGHKTLVLTVM